MLYYRSDDPEERNNLAALMPGKVAELDARIRVLKSGAKKVNVDSLNDVPEGSPDSKRNIVIMTKFCCWLVKMTNVGAVGANISLAEEI